MTTQLRRLQHRFPKERKHDAQLVVQACNHCGLDESDVEHLCERVFTEQGASDALIEFLKHHAKGQENADRFLLSLVPARPIPRDYIAEERWPVFKVWLAYRFRRLLRLRD